MSGFSSTNIPLISLKFGGCCCLQELGEMNRHSEMKFCASTRSLRIADTAMGMHTVWLKTCACRFNKSGEYVTVVTSCLCYRKKHEQHSKIRALLCFIGPAEMARQCAGDAQQEEAMRVWWCMQYSGVISVAAFTAFNPGR